MKEFDAAYMKELTQRMEIEYARKQGAVKGKLAMAEKILAQNLISTEKLAEITELPLSQLIAIKHSVTQA